VSLSDSIDSLLILRCDHFSVTLEYGWGAASLEGYFAECVARGRAYFSNEEVRETAGQSPRAFVSAAQRPVGKRALASPEAPGT
jgi:hypothetical protein